MPGKAIVEEAWRVMDSAWRADTLVFALTGEKVGKKSHRLVRKGGWHYPVVAEE